MPRVKAFRVNAKHQLVLVASLPFVHKTRRSYRLSVPVNSTDRNAYKILKSSAGSPQDDESNGPPSFEQVASAFAKPEMSNSVQVHKRPALPPRTATNRAPSAAVRLRAHRRLPCKSCFMRMARTSKRSEAKLCGSLAPILTIYVKTLTMSGQRWPKSAQRLPT